MTIEAILQNSAHPALDVIDNFPSYERAGPYLQQMVTEHGYKAIADVGGGANPMLDHEFVVANGIRYCLIDKSVDELRKANAVFEKIHADATTSNDVFQKQIAGRKFDLIFSHMLLEHLENPFQAHKNFYAALNPGGRCVHFYPSPNNLPLALNRYLPEAVTALLLRFAQPLRDMEGTQRKFKAYYRMCGAPSLKLTRTFEAIGYAVDQHIGYVGHPYYERFTPAAFIEKRLRRALCRFGIPMTGGCLLVLQKTE